MAISCLQPNRVLTSKILHFKHSAMASYFKSSLTAKTKNGKPKIPYTPVPRGATAPCWKVAVIDPQDQDYVLCKVQEMYGGKECPWPRLSRGSRKGAKGTTGNITEHMKKYHLNEFGPLLEAAAEKKALLMQSQQNKLICHFHEKILV